MSEISTKPYLIRAIHEWCVDNGYRPYLAVSVDENTIVPHEFVRSGEIVLNISVDATNRLQLGNELIEFEARFNQVARQLSIPVANVTAIYAAENGQGMAFDLGSAVSDPASEENPLEPDSPDAASVGVVPRADADSSAKRSATRLSAVSSARAKEASADSGDNPPEPPPAPNPGKPRLTRVK